MLVGEGKTYKKICYPPTDTMPHFLPSPQHAPCVPPPCPSTHTAWHRGGPGQEHAAWTHNIDGRLPQRPVLLVQALHAEFVGLQLCPEYAVLLLQTVYPLLPLLPGDGGRRHGRGLHGGPVSHRGRIALAGAVGHVYTLARLLPVPDCRTQPIVFPVFRKKYPIHKTNNTCSYQLVEVLIIEGFMQSLSVRKVKI